MFDIIYLRKVSKLYVNNSTKIIKLGKKINKNLFCSTPTIRKFFYSK